MAKKSFSDISNQAARAFIGGGMAAQTQNMQPAVQDETAEPAQPVTNLQPRPNEAPNPPMRRGRPRTNKREITKSSQENLPENWTRATFIVRENTLEAFKDQAYADGRTLKDAINLAMEAYLRETGK